MGSGKSVVGFPVGVTEVRQLADKDKRAGALSGASEYERRSAPIARANKHARRVQK